MKRFNRFPCFGLPKPSCITLINSFYFDEKGESNVDVNFNDSKLRFQGLAALNLNDAKTDLHQNYDLQKCHSIV